MMTSAVALDQDNATAANFRDAPDGGFRPAAGIKLQT